MTKIAAKYIVIFTLQTTVGEASKVGNVITSESHSIRFIFTCHTEHGSVIGREIHFTDNFSEVGGFRFLVKERAATVRSHHITKLVQVTADLQNCVFRLYWKWKSERNKEFSQFPKWLHWNNIYFDILALFIDMRGLMQNYF